MNKTSHINSGKEAVATFGRRAEKQPGGSRGHECLASLTRFVVLPWLGFRTEGSR